MENFVFEKCDKKYLNDAIELSKKATMVYGNNTILKIGIAKPIVEADLPYLYIARAEERVVACLTCYSVMKKEDIVWFECKNNKNCFELGRGLVDEAFRGRGLIGKLAEFIINEHKNSDFYFDTMYAPIKNESCIKAFEKLGFEKLFVKDWFDKKHNVQTSWQVMHYKNY